MDTGLVWIRIYGEWIRRRCGYDDAGSIEIPDTPGVAVSVSERDDHPAMAHSLSPAVAAVAVTAPGWSTFTSGHTQSV